MKKSSKQNKNNRKNSKKHQTKNQRRQQRKAKMQAKLNGPPVESAEGVDALKATQRRKALLAQFRQTQWKQKIKAGKVAGAKVEKVYNRGG